MRFRFQAGGSTPAPVVVLPARRQLPAAPRGATRTSRLFCHGTVAAAVLVALAGCATADRIQALAWKVEPVLDVRHGAPSSEAYYALGRYHDGSQAWDKAIDAYRKAIAADARNVEAYNALGVALARSDRYAEAEASLRKAADIDPRSAHVRSNLGLVLLLAGRPSEAIVELQTALKADPENVTARANLREALAQWEFRQASRKSDVPADASPVPASPVPAVVPVPAEMQVIDRPTAPALQIGVAAGSSGLPVKITEPIVPVGLALSQAASATMSIQLELSNGNGIKGAAARMKRWLTAEGLQVDRLTNRRPYDQQQTVIQYRAGQQEAALRVARTLRMTAQLDATPSTYLQSDVRVVLGHDWVRTAACLERNACERPALVAAAPKR